MDNEKEKPQTDKKPGLIRRFFRWWCMPSRMALGTLLVAGIVIALVGVLGFNMTMSYISSEKFCISCHEMRDHAYTEYMQSSHYTNASGFKATCSDCHVPKPFIPMMISKFEGLRDIYGSMTGLIDTPEKYEQHRLAMAQRVWDRMKGNDSRECRNCHSFEYMDLAQQKTASAQFHTYEIDQQQTCIDCHKGIVHQLPNMEGIDTGF